MTPTRICPDCPAARARLLMGLVESERGCLFRCLPSLDQAPLPMSWGGDYAFGLIRRGIVIRQRVDGAGRATAIDIAGPGSAIPISPDGSATSYSLGDALVCLVPSVALYGAMAKQRVALDVVAAHRQIVERVERISDAKGRRSATARVAALLVTIVETLSPGRGAVIPSAIRQRDLAALLALRHESVCRAMRVLERRSMIRRRGADTWVDAGALASV